jgi:tRNA (guanine-N7-)-methyltransferase
LYQWHVAKCDAHPYFRRLTDEELAADPAATTMETATEESKKVDRLGGRKYVAVYERLDVVEQCRKKPKLLDLW